MLLFFFVIQSSSSWPLVSLPTMATGYLCWYPWMATGYLCWWAWMATGYLQCYTGWPLGTCTDEPGLFCAGDCDCCSWQCAQVNRWAALCLVAAGHFRATLIVSCDKRRNVLSIWSQGRNDEKPTSKVCQWHCRVHGNDTRDLYVPCCLATITHFVRQNITIWCW